MICKNDLKTKAVLFFLGLFFLTAPKFISANSLALGQETNFFIDSGYDVSAREKISAGLQRIGGKAYFYVETKWWNSLDYSAKETMRKQLRELDFEFSNRIYPRLTSAFGKEWSPGIDNDEMITILIHEMKDGVAGYFNEANEHLKIEYPQSNEREMVYLSAASLPSSLAKSFLAHEFIHLITFNQKNKIRKVEEDVWLNEARAEYAPTLVGYDDDFTKSNLKARTDIFLSYPFDSLTEWRNQKIDYGVLNLFTQYLVEQYGLGILSDSLKSDKTGIESINWALKKNNYEEDFSKAFVNWTIAVLANDCELGRKYCYQSKNLDILGVVPSLNILPLEGESTLAVTNKTKSWSGNWFQIIGGKGTLKLEFIGDPNGLFKAPYLERDFDGNYTLKFFSLDQDQRAEVLISNFGSKIRSVIIIPSAQSKTSSFLNPEPSFSYFWSASIVNAGSESQEGELSPYLDRSIIKMSKQEILNKIAEVEKLLEVLKEQLYRLAAADGSGAVAQAFSCGQFGNNLYLGLKNDEVKCLQEFLKTQGAEIYPEGLITGYFGPLTQMAAVRFQEKYKDEILLPWGLTNGTGFVGSTTREKLNALLEKG